MKEQEIISAFKALGYGVEKGPFMSLEIYSPKYMRRFSVSPNGKIVNCYNRRTSSGGIKPLGKGIDRTNGLEILLEKMHASPGHYLTLSPRWR